MIPHALVLPLAAASLLFALGSIWFGKFESGIPPWRGTLKLALVLALVALVAWALGTGAALVMLFGLTAFATTTHFVECGRHGIDPWTAEPWERYRKLRGWTS